MGRIHVKLGPPWRFAIKYTPSERDNVLFRQEGLFPPDIAGQYLRDGLEVLILNQLVVLSTDECLLLSQQDMDQFEAALSHIRMVFLASGGFLGKG